MKNNSYKPIGLVAVIGFILHLIWENAQMPLYANYPGFAEHFLICLRGTFWDVVIVLGVCAVVSLVKGSTTWITNLDKATVILTSTLGLLVAIVIEQRALLEGRWEYALSMPRLPFFDVGLSPILQMVILLPVIYWLSGYYIKKYDK